MNVSVYIERLVLDGVAVGPGRERRLRDALQTELTRLLAEGGLSPALLANGAVPRLPAGAIQRTSEDDPTRLGQEIARALYGGIGR